MILLFASILPVFLLMGTGFCLRRVGWLTREADSSLLKVVVNLLYPALIFHYTVGNPALQAIGNLIWAPLLGCTLVLAGYGVGWLAAGFLGWRGGRTQPTFAFTSGLQNYGYIPIPLIELLFQSRETMAVLLVHNVGVELAFWTIGVLIISARGGRVGWRNLINAPVCALILALTLNLTGIGTRLPLPILETVGWLSACAVPLGLLLAGATLGDLVDGGTWARTRRFVLGASLVRLGILPLVFLGAALWMPISLELRQVLMVQAAMPAALFPLVVNRFYGGDNDAALGVVLGTTILSFFTMPFWIWVGLRLLPL